MAGYQGDRGVNRPWATLTPGGMILGTGVDIIEVDRIRGSYERFGERFVRRILSDGELAYCLANRDPAPFLAARFRREGSDLEGLWHRHWQSVGLAGHGSGPEIVGRTLRDSA
jgi:hypothetical protein